MALQVRVVVSGHLVSVDQVNSCGTTLCKSTVIELDVPNLNTAIAQHIHLLLRLQLRALY